MGELASAAASALQSIDSSRASNVLDMKNDDFLWPCIALAFVLLAVPALAIAYFAFRKARARLRDDSYRQRLGDLLEGPPPASVRGAYSWLWIAVTALFAL